MTEVTENCDLNGVLEPVESAVAAVEDENSEEKVSETAPENLEDYSVPRWAVGDPCQATWSEDGQVYAATVVAVDGERCRVRFSSYGNEEDMEVSVLRSPEAAPQTQNSQLQEWRPGSRCRAVYSEDGLVYPAVVLWVKGHRCRVRYDDYNNEEEHDVSNLLNPDELHGPSRAATSKVSSWKCDAASSNPDWKRRRRREETQERRSAWRDDQQNPPTVKERAGSLIKEEKEAEEKSGNQPRDEAEKPTNHSFPLFPPFPPPQTGKGDHMSFLPPPLPPFWVPCGKEAGGPPDVSTITNMLTQWYICGFHTGSYMTQQLFKSTLKDEVKSPR
ncbi:uncharacterized protein PAE49_017300 isoform 1-T1 [Odontesthes bonariensis]|uniref:uncharacterized protein LOC142399926 isoform X1 n=1 Tax=Odontesthes bonariensis TaxID=219752 RepID=UPI003F587A56